jgi:hypothetical protein
MKREGLESGVPDLLIVDRGKRLALEMKARGGRKPSPAQVGWLDHFVAEGWGVAVCYGAEEAIAWLEEELEL